MQAVKVSVGSKGKVSVFRYICVVRVGGTDFIGCIVVSVIGVFVM